MTLSKPPLLEMSRQVGFYETFAAMLNIPRQQPPVSWHGHVPTIKKTMSEPSPVQVARSGSNASLRRLGFRALAVTVAASVLFVVLLVALVLGPMRSYYQASSPPFCCPVEGSLLASMVNGEFKPCDNLYAYVCTSVTVDGTEKSNMLLRSLKDMISERTSTPTADSFSSLSLPRSRTVAFLRSLYATCMVSLATEAQRDENGLDVPARYLQMAAALWDTGRDLLSRLDEANLLIYLLKTNFIYQISSVVQIDYTTSDATFLIDHDALDWNSEMHLVCRACVSAALSAYRRQAASETPVTINNVVTFAKLLHKLYPKRRFIERFVMANISRLWPAEHFAEALTSLSWMGSSDGFGVESFGTKQLIILRQQITKRKNWAVGAVYLVAHTVARGYLDVPLNINGQADFHCERFATRLPHLVDTAYWELYGDSDKEHLISGIFKSVLDSVVLEVTSKILVSAVPNDVHLRLHALMANITLLTAAATDYDLTNITEADTSDFVHILLLGRSFEFQARKKRDALGISPSISEVNPVLHTGRHMYLEVPASFYSFVRVAKSPSPLNMAVLGSRLAEILWRVVLLEEWEADSRANVDKLLRCFADAHKSPGAADHYWQPEEYEVTVRHAASSLALRTVAKAMSHRGGWYIARQVVGDSDSVLLSHAQFFFLQEAYGRCPGEGYRADEDYVNVPADFVSEFERAFHCPLKARMKRLRACAA